ncbi:MAG: response regulator [Deltaproteobacteria bacterium]|nr:response regulator [Deltaproteobacteria bacterium]
MDSASTDSAPRVLVVDDERVIREILADFLTLEGFWVRTAEDGSAALAELSKQPYDVVISDLKMPKIGGLELLEAIGRSNPNIITVIMTGFGTVDTAIDAMKRGAFDYVLKPFKGEEVVYTIQRALDKRRLNAENLRLKEALSLYKVSEAITQSLSLDEVLTTVTIASIDDVRADFVSVMFDDPAAGWFERAERSRPGEDRGGPNIEPGEIRLDGDALAAFFRDETVLLMHGAKARPFFSAISAPHIVHSLVAVPLRVRGRLIGAVSVVSLTANQRFDEGQRKLLAMIGSRAAAAIENARLYEDLKATFNQTIQGLARAIDKMDRYTAGHSDRVAEYAALLAKRIQLPPDTITVVRQAALMHDIGKIGCVMNLNKPGKLSQEEYEIFKRHPGYGRDILEPIKFLHPIIPGVHLHHERWDGRGYPLGLKAESIPIIARLISVADTYDAMTSDRSYRKALPHEVAVAEVERCSSTQFDPYCANEFMTVIEEYREELKAQGLSIPE